MERQMGLLFTGRVTRGRDFDHLMEAEDTTTGRRLVVAVSQEAIDDFELEVVRAKAELKFDAGIIDTGGRVTISTADFQ